MDIVDHAQDHEEAIRSRQIEHARGRQAEPVEDCIACGDEIPEERREAMPGVQRCIDCQSNKERGNVI